MRHKIIMVLLCCIFFLSGCATSQQNESDTDKEITVEYLENNDSLFFENLVFLQNDGVNHVFVIKDKNIVRHYKYPEVEKNMESFNMLNNQNIIDAVEYIGIPSFVGVSNELSLDYICQDGHIRRVKMYKQKEELLIKEIVELDLDNPTSWFDEEKLILPTYNECAEIKQGMPIDEVVRKIGKPQRDVGSGACIFQFDVSNGSILQIMFDRYLDGDELYHRNYMYVVSVEFLH